MKNYLEAFLISVLAIFTPIKPMVITVAVLVASDTLFGMWAARKRGEPITSAGMRRTLSKSIIYESAILASYLVEKYLIEDAMPVSKIVAGLVGAVELKSILENLDAINGSSLFASIVNRIGSKNDKSN